MLRLVSFLLVSSSLFAAVSAEAQHAVPRFEPAPAGDRFFGVASADVPGQLTFHGGLVFDYAHQSFVFKDSGSGDVVESLIDQTLLMHAQGSLALWDRLEISLSLPVALAQRGDDPVYQGQTLSSPSGAALGDLRAGARVRLVGPSGAPFQLGLSGYLWLPTGSEEDLLSDGAVRGAPFLNASGRVGRFIWGAQVGVELRPSVTLYGAREGSMMRAGAAGGVILGEREQVQLGAELYGLTVLRDPSSRASGLELLASGKWRFVKDFELGGAVGPGLVGGVGTPSVRALLSLMYTPREEATAVAPAPAPSTPAETETVEAPTPDSDGDGIDDRADACPNERGAKNAERPGCPPVAEVREKAVEPEPLEPAPAPDREVLSERVQFPLGDASVPPAYATTLDAVRDRIQRDPTKKLTIEGHSDDVGALDYNQQLSERRAENAKAALVARGISADRIEVRGYGPTRPLVEGTSPEARARNRRVEFVLHR